LFLTATAENQFRTNMKSQKEGKSEDVRFL